MNYGKHMTASKTASRRASKDRYHHGDLKMALLRAAEAELAENGIESFSLRAVAKRAGVSHGAPAHHFKDAKGLLTALAQRPGPLRTPYNVLHCTRGTT